MKKSSVQETVSKEYARMLKDTETRKSGGACQSGPGTIAGLAGYAPELHQKEAASQSFGCGNPLVFADIEPGQTVLDLGSGAGLENVDVTQCLVYELSQLVSLIRCEFPGLDLSEELIDEIAPMVFCKVWSAKFVGRMPREAGVLGGKVSR